MAMQSIDWTEVGTIGVGVSIGSLIGFYLTRNRAPHPKVATMNPTREAVLTALACFLAFALVEDCLELLKGERRGGYFLVKYVFAFGVGLYRYADVLRSKRKLAGQG